MRKFLLLLSCSLIASQTAQALSVAEQMNAMRDIYVGEFQKIDEDKDGFLNMEEFLKYQFSELRRTLSQSDGFEMPKSDTKNVPSENNNDTQPIEQNNAENQKDIQEKGLEALSAVSLTLQSMADYNEDLDDGYDYDALLSGDVNTSKESLDSQITDETKDLSKNLTNEAIDIPEIDLSISEEDALKNILEEKVETSAPQKTEAEKEAQNKHIQFMLNAIKRTLPKKIDEITTWTDIKYQDSTFTYIYKADVDTSKFSDEEKASLKSSIETVACAQAYGQMCASVKTMFIDDGINMRILYLDKAENEISICEFNEHTCP